jgi:hypothetical protein
MCLSVALDLVELLFKKKYRHASNEKQIVNQFPE